MKWISAIFKCNGGLFYSNIIELFDSLELLKFNSKYISILLDVKIEQVLRLFDGFSLMDLLFGKLSVLGEGYGGDFGWLYFILGYGFISLFVLVSFIISKATKATVIPIIIALFSTLHYPVIFFLPGQIILGYLMAKKNRV
mgnify:CR=1 FL=1